MKNLLVQASLTEPPSDSLAIYSIFMISKTKFNMNILLLTEQEMKDFYYKYLKIKGLHDYIDYILVEEEKQERGLKLTNENGENPLIKLKMIVFENQVSILNSIRKYV